MAGFALSYGLRDSIKYSAQAEAGCVVLPCTRLQQSHRTWITSAVSGFYVKSSVKALSALHCHAV